MVNILTGTPFEAVPRLHHRADEVALEGDSNAGSRRALLAARGAMFGRSGSSAPTARSYVQDGLVAMWDGIENAGYGVHDAEATVWRDLVGDNNLERIDGGGISFGDSYADINKTRCGNIPITYRNVECVFNQRSYGLVIEDQANNTFFGIYNSSETTASYGSQSNGYLQFPNLALNKTYSVSFRQWENEQRFVNGRVCSSTKYDWWTNYGKTKFGLQGRNGSAPASFMLYNVRLYNRRLTDEEIAANYAVDAARFGLTS